MKYEEIVNKIIAEVGGEENINNIWHCMTRLRLNLKDQGKINYKNLEKIKEVLGTKFQSDQLQVVMGTDVAQYYAAAVNILGIDENPMVDANEKKGVVSLFMDTVSGVFGPIVPAIAGAGMIRGLMNGMAAQNLMDSTSHTFQVIDMISGGVFTFLPFFVAVSAARIFKTNMYLALAIAAAMQFPTMTAAVSAGELTNFMLFGFMPVPVFNYAGNVIPIILSILALSYIHRWVDKRLPKVLRTVFTPTISLFVGGIVSFAVIGPIGIYLGRALASVIGGLFNISPVLAGVIVGAIRPISIFTGLHHAMTPISLQNFADQGWDMLMPMMFMANMAITGATLGVYFRTKDKEEKSIVMSSAISGLLGITEPALFGVLSKYKGAFLAATAGSTVASAFIGYFGVRLFGFILSSIFSLPAYVGDYFGYALLGIVIAITLSTIMSYVLVGKEMQKSVKNLKNFKSVPLS